MIPMIVVALNAANRVLIPAVVVLGAMLVMVGVVRVSSVLKLALGLAFLPALVGVLYTMFGTLPTLLVLALVGLRLGLKLLRGFLRLFLGSTAADVALGMLAFEGLRAAFRAGMARRR